jgi:hypothetical protein
MLHFFPYCTSSGEEAHPAAINTERCNAPSAKAWIEALLLLHKDELKSMPGMVLRAAFKVVFAL